MAKGHPFLYIYGNETPSAAYKGQRTKSYILKEGLLIRKREKKDMLSDQERDEVVGGKGYVYYTDDGDTRRAVAADHPLTPAEIKLCIDSRGTQGGFMYMEAPDAIPGMWEQCVVANSESAFGPCDYIQVDLLRGKR